MAFSEGDRVLVAQNTTAGVVPYPISQPPTFGTISDISGTPDMEVQWDNGNLTSAVDEDALDKVLAPSSAALEFRGKVVRLLNDGGSSPADDFSASFDALVVLVYARGAGGADVGNSFLLCKTLNGEAWFEVPLTSATILSAR